MLQIPLPPGQEESEGASASASTKPSPGAESSEDLEMMFAKKTTPKEDSEKVGFTLVRVEFDLFFFFGGVLSRCSICFYEVQRLDHIGRCYGYGTEVGYHH